MKKPQEAPSGPVCQSCGMPMGKEEDFGTEEDGSPSIEFCSNCYQNGIFTEPDISMREMIEKVSGILATIGFTKAKAEKVANETIPRLNRWRRFGTEYL